MIEDRSCGGGCPWRKDTRHTLGWIATSLAKLNDWYAVFHTDGVSAGLCAPRMSDVGVHHHR